MPRHSFCMLFLGFVAIGLAGFFSAFGSSWGAIPLEYSDGDKANEWLLLGALTSTSCQVKAKLPLVAEEDTVLVVSVEPELADDNRTVIPINASDLTLGVRHDIYTLDVTGLTPNTRYYYAIVVSTTGSETRREKLKGQFRTPEPEGTRFNFTVAASGCAWTGSTANIFAEIQDLDPLLFLHMGDFHYEDVDAADLQKRVDAVSQVLASDPQAELYRSTALTYMWDDHDFLGNNANADEKVEGARLTALQAYQVAFPHYPLVATSDVIGNSTSSTGGPVPPYHAFTIGTIRFIISDVRSEATKPNIMSGSQKAWLKRELRSAPNYDFVIWVTTKPWIGDPSRDSDGDGWNAQVDDREEISDFITAELAGANASQNLLVLSSDTHNVAFDDGTNTYFGSQTEEQVMSFPLLHSGPLDRLGSDKGGKFSHGCRAFDLDRTNQFSTLKFEFSQNGDNKCIQINSYRTIAFSESSRNEIFSHRLCNQIFQPAATSDEDRSGSCNVDAFWTVNTAILITSAVLAGVVILATCFFLNKTDATTIGDCCFKSTAMFLLVVVGFVATAAVGLGVYLGRGITQYTLSPVLIVLLLQNFLFLVYLCVWISCCTHSNRRLRTNDDDDGDIDVNNPNNMRTSNSDDAGMGTNKESAQVY